MLNIIEIKNTIDATLEKHNIRKEDLCQENGNYIYYMNGNDGTDFDATVNDMTCEFYCFYKETEIGAVKLNLTNYDNDTKLRVYVFDKIETQKVLEQANIDTDLSFEDTCEYLLGSFDERNIYDEPITSWDLPVRSEINFDGYYEDDDDYYDDDYEDDDYDSDYDDDYNEDGDY